MKGEGRCGKSATKRLGMSRVMAFGLLLQVVMLFLLAACKPTVPREFISQGKMEDILYDYHLANAMAQMGTGNYNENLLLYHEEVLKKYGVTQAEFDTSMVYYMRHTDMLYQMYENITKRMQNEARALGSTTEPEAGMMTASGDTADIWKGQRSLMLFPDAPYNVYTYQVKIDTAFHKGDIFKLTFGSDFIMQDGMRDGVVGITMRLNNDSVVARTMHISYSNTSSLQVEDLDSIGLKAMTVFFFMPRSTSTYGSATTLQLMNVNNIRLFRYHAHRQEVAPQSIEGNIPLNSHRPESIRARRPQGMPTSAPAQVKVGEGPQPMQVEEPLNRPIKPVNTRRMR